MDHTTAPQSHAGCNGCEEYLTLSRRGFLRAAGGVAAALSAPAWLPRVAFGRGPGAGRDVIVSIYLRGGADGLTMVAPYGDPLYLGLRGGLAVRPPDFSDPVFRSTNLNGFFGLPPALSGLIEPYNAGKLAVIHAVGSTDTTRSHFDAQRSMEVGVTGSNLLFTGWLGRHLNTVAPVMPSQPVRGIGISFGLQRTLAGGDEAIPVPSMTSYGLTGSSSTRTTRLNHLTQTYAAAAESQLAQAAAETAATITLLQTVNAGAYVPPAGATYPTSSFGTALKQTAALLRANVGVEAVAIDKGGWDTHASQSPFAVGGSMYDLMLDTSNGLVAFYRDIMANAGLNVTVIVMSEFGRRVAVNASSGTDHGYGSCMFVMGPHINGGQVYGTWPTLGNLFQNLDLRVTTDYRHVLSEIIQRRLGNNNIAGVFPGFTPQTMNIAQV
jgi:uncharacterized protein (DUF1501 family)